MKYRKFLYSKKKKIIINEIHIHRALYGRYSRKVLLGYQDYLARYVSRKDKITELTRDRLYSLI